MASGLTRETICNKAMVLLGAAFIGSLDAPTTPNARTLALLYPLCRDAELRKRRWLFARVSETIARDAAWTGSKPKAYRYQLTAGAVRVIKPKYEDWIIQGRYLYTDDKADSLDVDVIKNDIPVTDYDPCFVDVLSARLALDACETLTQSNTKKSDSRDAYRSALGEAAKVNAFETDPDEPKMGTWAQELGG